MKKPYFLSKVIDQHGMIICAVMEEHPFISVIEKNSMEDQYVLGSKAIDASWVGNYFGKDVEVKRNKSKIKILADLDEGKMLIKKDNIIKKYKKIPTEKLITKHIVEEVLLIKMMDQL